MADRPTGAAAPVVALRNWSKSFGGARALDDVSLSIEPGEVHGLLGQNGSGKSTLIKVLAGFHDPEEGAELEVNGRPVPMPLPPNRFRELGIAFVHQDLGLVNDLTVLENLRIGMLAASRSLRVPWKRERRAARETFARFGLDIDPDVPVSDLTETERALLAIVRAVEEMREHLTEGLRGLLVLDEPTVFLPAEGVDRLFGIVRDVVAEHASVLFVSHDLTEVREITDRITVLRDGRVAGTVRTADTTQAELIELIVGHKLEQATYGGAGVGEHDVRARVRGLTGLTVRDVDFAVRRGEILGVTGLMGSGFEELPYLLFGARQPTSGELELDGRTTHLPTLEPAQACAAGLALVPADRQTDGSVGDLPVADNLMLQVIDAYRGPLGLRGRRIEEEAARQLERFDVRPRDPRLPYEALSGGNQQKVLMAKWLQCDPALLLLHEPTQGVDIGAREQIFALLADVARDGKSVLVASSDHEQLATLCDRVLIFGRGRVVAELEGADVTKERIAHETLGSASLAATAHITEQEVVAP